MSQRPTSCGWIRAGVLMVLAWCIGWVTGAVAFAGWVAVNYRRMSRG